MNKLVSKGVNYLSKDGENNLIKLSPKYHEILKRIKKRKGKIKRVVYIWYIQI